MFTVRPGTNEDVKYGLGTWSQKSAGPFALDFSEVKTKNVTLIKVNYYP